MAAAETSTTESSTLEKADMPTEASAVFWAGIAIGLILVVLAVAALAFKFLILKVALYILAAGISLILSVFGAQATIRFKWKVASGVFVGTAAITLGSFAAIAYSLKNDFVRVIISGDGVETAEIRVVGDSIYLGALRDGNYQFVVFDSETNKDIIEVRMKTENAFLRFRCVDMVHLQKEIGTGRTVSLRIVNDKLFKETGRQRSEAIADATHTDCSGAVARASLLDWFVRSAHAQGASKGDIERGRGLLAKALNASTDVRVETAHRLAEIGPSFIPILLKESGLDLNPVDYDVFVRNPKGPSRSETGLKFFVMDTLTLMADRYKPDQIKPNIERDTIDLLSALAADDDKVVRTMSGDFLLRVQDPRVSSPATKILAMTGNADAKYNMLLLLEMSARRSDPQARKAIQETAQSYEGKIGPRSDEIINRITSLK